jgi:hypothetical protein
MSRNLCQIDCEFCKGVVTLDEPARPITKAETGSYFPEYGGMLVANATCRLCKAKYLAWVDERPSGKSWARHTEDDNKLGFHDLSFREAFNDEPANADMPEFKIETVKVRVPWPKCECGGNQHYGTCLKCYKRTTGSLYPCRICGVDATNKGASMPLCSEHMRVWLLWCDLGRGADPDGFVRYVGGEKTSR